MAAVSIFGVITYDMLVCLFLATRQRQRLMFLTTTFLFLFLLGLYRQVAGTVGHLGYLVIEELGMHWPLAGGCVLILSDSN